MDASRLLDGLDPSQRRAVTSEAQPLAILAGAGSGKTRVLTRRIAHRCATGSADPRHVLALTFTRKAAGELDGRLRAFGLRDLPAAGTFHAVAYAQLRARWAATGAAAPKLLDRKVRFLGRILGGTTRMSPGDLATEIEWAKARLVTPEGYALAAAQADRRTGVAPERIGEWFGAYELEKRRRGVVDFDDLLVGCTRAIEGDPSFAAAQRWRFRHVFVDEYQDLNPLQERLLRAWLGPRTDLCVVGDPNQAIYGWNGADASFLLRFAEQHPGAEVVRLEGSYRSTPQILSAAASLLRGDGGRLLAHRPDGPPPTITAYATDVDEANGIARSVHDHHVPGRPWSAQAVLVRTNAQAALLEAAFRRGAIPYRVRGGAALLEQPDVRDLVRRLDGEREPLVTTLSDLESSLASQRAQLLAESGIVGDDDDDEADAAWAFESTLDTTATGRRLLAHEQVVRLGRDLLLMEPAARTDDFGAWLRTVLQDDTSTRTDAVSIVSFHAAKGLEWPIVHLAGLEAGLVPITHARTPEARAEERRLLYVAVTRAADVLRCSWAAKRTYGERTVDRSISPLLQELAASVDAARPSETAAAPRAGLASSRAALAEEPPDTLRAELRAWRANEARKAAVVPTVVLSDRGLEAIAHRRPTTEAELAEIADVGRLARSRYGARLLEIVAGHPDTDRHPLALEPRAADVR
jgi:DNA helicase-2/ATP-dependent DNA helicase PcrA